MKVYFVRHGESELTEAKHQSPETPLSKRGNQQASFTAHRFTNIPIDLILTSSYTRALQTAQAIKEVKAVAVNQSDLLIERRMPSSFLSKSIHDPKIMPIHQTIREHFYEPGWHYADEENFTDLITRVKAALEFIHSQEKENIVVVTHGYFLTVMIYFILFEENADPQSFQSFRDHTANSNTGITLCEYIDDKWKLLTWNDIAHLG